MEIFVLTSEQALASDLLSVTGDDLFGDVGE